MSEKLRDRLGEFADGLKSSLGERLKMAAAYGSVVRGEFKPGHSDVNVLLVCDRVDAQLLDLLREPLHELRHEISITPLVLADDELAAAADSFATLFADVRLNYEVLLGDDLLAALEVASADIRVSCEREVRNVAVRLRRAYAMGSERPSLLRVALKQSLPHLFGTLRILLTLGGQTPPGSLPELLELSAGQLGYDQEPLVRAAESRRRAEGDEIDLDAIYRDLFSVLDHISRAVDEL